MMRSSYGSWLYKRGAQWPKERSWVICLDKNGSINLLDAELRTRIRKYNYTQTNLKRMVNFGFFLI